MNVPLMSCERLFPAGTWLMPRGGGCPAGDSHWRGPWDTNQRIQLRGARQDPTALELPASSGLPTAQQKGSPAQRASRDMSHSSACPASPAEGKGDLASLHSQTDPARLAGHGRPRCLDQRSRSPPYRARRRPRRPPAPPQHALLLEPAGPGPGSGRICRPPTSVLRSLRPLPASSRAGQEISLFKSDPGSRLEPAGPRHSGQSSQGRTARCRQPLPRRGQPGLPAADSPRLLSARPARRARTLRPHVSEAMRGAAAGDGRLLPSASAGLHSRGQAADPPCPPRPAAPGPACDGRPEPRAARRPGHKASGAGVETVVWPSAALPRRARLLAHRRGRGNHRNPTATAAASLARGDRAGDRHGGAPAPLQARTAQRGSMAGRWGLGGGEQQGSPPPAPGAAGHGPPPRGPTSGRTPWQQQLLPQEPPSLSLPAAARRPGLHPAGGACAARPQACLAERHPPAPPCSCDAPPSPWRQRGVLLRLLKGP